MLFWLFLVIFVVVVLATVVVPVVVALNEDLFAGFGFMALMFILSAFMSAFVLVPWSKHAEDLSKVRAQQPVIKVYEERRDTLATVLENFNYPIRDGITLNADSPVASVVEQLSEVESKLADVKAEVALARRSIEARRAGPMGGIVTLMGDE